jgi:hypothetical protein
MKLKTVVASMVVLGGLSTSAFATPFDINSACPTCNPANVADTSALTTANYILTQNQPGGFYQCGWFDRIFLSGRINTDAYLSNRAPIFTGFFGQQVTSRSSDLILNNANLFVDAVVNDWVKANVGLVYSSLVGVPGAVGAYQIPNSLFVRRPIPAGNLDTAYITVANPSCTSVYLRVGKEYIPFGLYDPYGFLNDNPTQLFAETNATVAQLGVIASGFYASVYAFNGNPRVIDQGDTRRIQNGGGNIGYGFANCDVKAKLDAGYLANVADTNLLSSYYTNFLVATPSGTSFVPGLPNKKVPAWNISAAINVEQFDLSAAYITTTRSVADPFSSFGDGTFADLGKARVWGVEAGFTFPVADHQSRVAIGYQKTNHLVNLLQKYRYYADYIVNLAEWFDLGVAVTRDHDYNTDQGGTGDKSTTGRLRFSVKFA